MWFLYYHFSGILFVMLLKIYTLSFALSYVCVVRNPLANPLYHTTNVLMKKCGCLSGPHTIIIVYKKVFSEQVLSYIIYEKLMPPTTTVRVGVGGKIMAAVFYVLWAIKKWWCITRGLSLITLHVYTLRSPINSALFFFSLLF